MAIDIRRRELIAVLGGLAARGARAAAGDAERSLIVQPA